MKKSLEETIQYMREQNWIKEWMRCKRITSLDAAYTEIRRRYESMSKELPNCSIVWGINSKFVDKYGERYVESIRESMHKWMFNY